MAAAQWERPVALEIPVRAVPKYLSDVAPSASAWREVPPGHRFQLYFHGWADFGVLRYRDEQHWKRCKAKVREAADHADRGVLEKEGAEFTSRGPLKDKKRIALEAACGMGAVARDILRALETRANALAGEGAWVCDIRLLAPLATGLGLPHPVENGFSFCPPYGVPFLPGSAVKGVFRRAAELAALEEGSAWNPVSVWTLFGFDATTEWFDPGAEAHGHYLTWCGASWDDEVETEAAAWVDAIRGQLPKRWQDRPVREIFRGFAEVGSELTRSVHWEGLLVFHDAFPSPEAKMGVDILNPHHKDYYSGERTKTATPDDAENPVPVYFLVLRPGCRLTLRVSCPAKDGAVWKGAGSRWRALLDTLRGPVVRDLGFGAKTRVGYGYGQVDQEAAEARQKAAEERRRAEELARYPWRAHLVELRQAHDWGTFRQIVENRLMEHLAEDEVAEAIDRKANELAAKKWGPERDKLVSGWLAPSGRTWKSRTKKTGGEELDPDAIEAIQRIRSLKDWGDWQASGMSLDAIPRRALREVRSKFVEWGCDNRKAKKDKRDAWKKLQTLLKT